MYNFEVGTPVRIKNLDNQPEMIVARPGWPTSMGHMIDCGWFDNLNRWHSVTFNAELLELVE